MVEIPVDDAGIGHIAPKRFHLAAVSLRFEPVAAGCEQNIPSVGAVPGDAAVQTHLLQRHPFPIVGQHHGQGGRPAFERLHLHDDGDLDPALGGRGFDLCVHPVLLQLNSRVITCVCL